MQVIINFYNISGKISTQTEHNEFLMADFGAVIVIGEWSTLAD